MLVGVFILSRLEQKFPNSTSIDKLSKLKQKALGFIVVIISTAAGTGLAFPFIAIINLYFAPK